MEKLKLVADNKIIRSKFYDDEVVQLETKNGVLENVPVSWNTYSFGDEIYSEIEKVKIGDLELDQYQILKMCDATHIEFLEQQKNEEISNGE